MKSPTFPRQLQELSVGSLGWGPTQVFFKYHWRHFPWSFHRSCRRHTEAFHPPFSGQAFVEPFSAARVIVRHSGLRSSARIVHQLDRLLFSSARASRTNSPTARSTRDGRQQRDGRRARLVFKPSKSLSALGWSSLDCSKPDSTTSST